MSFPIQQVSCDNNIETGKVLNLFGDCVAECVPLLPGGTGKYTLLAPWQIHRQTGHQLK